MSVGASSRSRPHPYNPGSSRARARARTHEFNVPKESDSPEKPCQDPAHRHRRRPRGRRIQVRRSGIHGKGVFALRRSPRASRSSSTPASVITWKQAQKRRRTTPTSRTTRSSSTSTTSTSSTATTAATRPSGSTTPAARTARPTRRTTPRLHQGAARHRARRGAQLRLRPDPRRQQHEEGRRRSSRAAAARPECRGTMLAPEGERRRTRTRRRSERVGDPALERVAETGSTNDDLLGARPRRRDGGRHGFAPVPARRRPADRRPRPARPALARDARRLAHLLDRLAAARAPICPASRWRSACALADALDRARRPLRIGLKWPNDLWLVDDGARRRGAAAASSPACWSRPRRSARGRVAVIGVGINVRAQAGRRRGVAASPASPRSTPTATPAATLARVAPALFAALRAFDARRLRRRSPIASPRATCCAAGASPATGSGTATSKASPPASPPTARCGSTTAPARSRSPAANGASARDRARRVRHAEGAAGAAGRRQPGLLRVQPRLARRLPRPARARRSRARAPRQPGAAADDPPAADGARRASAPVDPRRAVLRDADLHRRRRRRRSRRRWRPTCRPAAWSRHPRRAHRRRAHRGRRTPTASSAPTPTLAARLATLRLDAAGRGFSFSPARGRAAALSAARGAARAPTRSAQREHRREQEQQPADAERAAAARRRGRRRRRRRRRRDGGRRRPPTASSVETKPALSVVVSWITNVPAAVGETTTESALAALVIVAPVRAGVEDRPVVAGDALARRRSTELEVSATAWPAVGVVVVSEMLGLHAAHRRGRRRARRACRRRRSTSCSSTRPGRRRRSARRRPAMPARAAGGRERPRASTAAWP